ncbi:hypothetical protein EVAR_92135_1 [Eumeta japonica]|uniref:Uncharacterized protein n=1 Tax=Eumeta variegata TaxID=151549 RepID=A0A4C1T195_EUMVA|nr:hypothetical protein EVAR_92135_1 [Eumeta japonica]
MELHKKLAFARSEGWRANREDPQRSQLAACVCRRHDNMTTTASPRRASRSPVAAPHAHALSDVYVECRDNDA